MQTGYTISLVNTFCERTLLNTFQKRSVSSPAPVTIASPSGDTACQQMNSTTDHAAHKDTYNLEFVFSTKS